jgi:hypothetical protein
MSGHRSFKAVNRHPAQQVAIAAKLDLTINGDYTKKAGPIEAEGALLFGVAFIHGVAGFYHAEALNDPRTPLVLWGLAPGTLFNGITYTEPVLLNEFRKLVMEKRKIDNEQPIDFPVNFDSNDVGVKRNIDFSAAFASPSKKIRLERYEADEPVELTSAEKEIEAKIQYKLREKAALREADAQQLYADNRIKMIGYYESKCTANSLIMLLQDQDYVTARSNQDFVRVAYIIRSKSSNQGSCHATNEALEAKLYFREFQFPSKGGNIFNYMTIWTSNWNHLTTNQSKFPWETYARMMIQQLGSDYATLLEDCLRTGFPKSLEAALAMIQKFYSEVILPTRSHLKLSGAVSSQLQETGTSTAMNVTGNRGNAGGRGSAGRRGSGASDKGGRGAASGAEVSTDFANKERCPHEGGCNSWWNTGTCRFGTKCRFSHEKTKSPRK